MKPLGVLSLAVVVTSAAFMWWQAGGPSWYGVAIMSLLAAKMILSWRAKDATVTTPEDQAQLDALRVGVAVPSFNEDPALLSRTLKSLYDQTRRPQSVVVVDDGSSDLRAVEEADRWVDRFADVGIAMQVVRFDENRGKRQGLIAAFDAQPDADVLLGVDSDTVLDPLAVAEGLTPMLDPQVMASTGLVLPLNHDTNVLTRLMDVRYANGFLFERAAYSSLGAVLCACGSLAFYRTTVVRKYREDFLNQTFLGKPAVFGDDRRMTNYALMEGRSVFQSTAVAFTAVPERLGHYVRQQVRWNKSFFRESVWALLNQPSGRPAFWLTAIELGTWFTFTCALVLAIVVNPILTGTLLIGPYLVYTALLAYARSTRYFEVTGIRKSRREVLYGFALAPLYGLLHIGLLVWLRLYALATLRSGTWGTRKDGVEVSVRDRAAPLPS
ncbi:glycosyltransferase [Oerskovia sp. NPDC057915]|uniref:glycosyltransferase n=1 Tax=Oerskovia sp. NPDC057915 TaxID=3346280 RepID=UPI0036DA0FA0